MPSGCPKKGFWSFEFLGVWLNVRFVANLVTVMVYRATILRRLAITQMVFGVLMFVFGITSIFVAEHWTSYIAFGVWVGVWVSFDQLFRIIGTLSKPIRQRQWERGRTKDLMGRTIASTCLLKLCTFHSRAPQNDNVELQKFASSASGNRDGKLIYFHLELKAA